MVPPPTLPLLFHVTLAPGPCPALTVVRLRRSQDSPGVVLAPKPPSLPHDPVSQRHENAHFPTDFQGWAQEPVSVVTNYTGNQNPKFALVSVELIKAKGIQMDQRKSPTVAQLKRLLSTVD